MGRGSPRRAEPGLPFGERPQRPLEQIPYKFSLSYICDDADCSGHRMQLIDWEAGELFRKTAGRPEEERLRLVCERWLDLVCGPHRDPQFFAGSIHQHPTSFVLLGVSGRRRSSRRSPPS